MVKGLSRGTAVLAGGPRKAFQSRMSGQACSRFANKREGASGEIAESKASSDKGCAPRQPNGDDKEVCKKQSDF